MLRPVRPGEIPQATADLARKVHRSGTSEMRVRDALGPLFADVDFTGGAFAGMYSGLGQPGLSPALLAMVMVLQFKANLSDREAAEAARDRISWKYALGVELDYEGFDASVLTEFRGRLAGDGRADALLDMVLDVLKESGLLRARGRARTDSTHVIAAVRQLNRTETAGEGLRVALEEIAAVSPGFIVPLLDTGWHERYGRRFETARLLGRGSAKTTIAALAGQVGADGAALLAWIDADRAAGWINLLPAVQLLRVLWEQQFTTGPAGALVLTDAADLAPSADRLHSMHDPEARYSTKGRGGEDDLEWVGTKCHLTESCDQDLPHLITDVHTTAATDPDVTATTDIQDKLTARELAPAEHLMDAGYPSAANISAAAASGIAPIAPVTVLNGRNANLGTFTTSDFAVNWAAGQATCPAGAISRSMRPDARGLVTFRFRVRDCRPCPLRDQCTTSTDPDRARTITIHPEPVHTARTNMIRDQDSAAWQQTSNARAGIEGTISQAVRGPGLRHARDRGLAKAHLQNVLSGIAINICRLGDHYAPKPKPPRRPTRVHELCLTTGIITAPA
jgi:transposase